MADPDDILRQYGPDPLPYPEEQPGYTPPSKDEHGFLFSNVDGQLKFNPWESLKSFMGAGHSPGYLSTSGNAQPIRDAFDTAGWVGMPGLGLNSAGALPANSVGVFGGRLGAANLAKQGIHAPEKAIQMAERMKAAGATPAEIWQATARFMEKEDPRFSAVHYGKEGAPQFEIPDYQAKWPARMADEWEMRNFMESRPGETLDHPLLYAAYPEMRDVPMKADARRGFPNEGVFDPGTFPGDIRDARFVASGKDPKELRSTAIHELDHGTAFIEGHAKGSSPERAVYVVDPNDFEMRNILAERDFLTKQFEKSVPGDDPHYRSRKADLDYANQALDNRALELGYKRSAGETRARNAQARADMTPEQLRARPPWETQDVPYEQQILEMYGEPRGPQRSVEMSLPMDEASRLARARKMGFDTDNVWYHGTEKSGFPSFDPVFENTNSQTGATGTYFTESRRNAATYSGRDKNANIIQDANDPFNHKWDGVPGIYSTFVRPGRQKVEDWGGLNWDEGPLGYDVNRAAQYAREQGYDSLLVNGITDEGRHGQGYHWGDQTLVVFDPSNIRSIDAAFDPAKSKSSDLLAARGIPIAEILKQYKDDKD